MEQDAQPQWIRDLSDKEAKLAALRDVRAERALEIQILQSREQWFWVPWTVCLAAGLSSQYSPSPIIRNHHVNTTRRGATGRRYWRHVEDSRRTAADLA